MDHDIDAVLKAYLLRRPSLERFSRALEQLVWTLLESEQIRVHQIQVRCKSPESLRDKILNRIERKQPYADPLNDITDLVGVRAILFYQDHVELAARVIEREFVIDAGNSAGQYRPSGVGTFGYRSWHLVGTLDSRRGGLPEWQPWARVRVEFQVRSILDHAWAEIEHTLIYEPKRLGRTIPEDLERGFSAQMAKLEEIDQFFSDARIRIEEASSAAEAEGYGHDARQLPPAPREPGPL